MKKILALLGLGFGGYLVYKYFLSEGEKASEGAGEGAGEGGITSEQTTATSPRMYALSVRRGVLLRPSTRAALMRAGIGPKAPSLPEQPTEQETVIY